MVLSPRDPDQKGNRFRDVNQSRWSSRGWTMQERSLSSRLIYFCRDKLYFECRGSSRSEENEPEATAPHLFGLWPRQGPSVESKELAGPSQYLYRQWQLAIAEYSRRSLTYGSDKLVAILQCCRRDGAPSP